MPIETDRNTYRCFSGVITNLVVYFTKKTFTTKAQHYNLTTNSLYRSRSLCYDFSIHIIGRSKFHENLTQLSFR